jgi:type II secretory pathway component PulK
LNNLYKNKKGVAILMVMVSVAIITMVIVDLNYTSRVNTSITSNYKQDVSSYYLAKSSINMALIRLIVYGRVKDMKFGDFEVPESISSLVWSFPFIFPPQEEMLTMISGEEGLSSSGGLINREFIKDIKEKSNIASVGYFDHSIEALDTKFNINIVASSEQLIELFREFLMNYYSVVIEKDESFGYRHSAVKIQRVYNNIIDWIDFDYSSRNGGNENIYYERLETPYKTRNAPIESIKELFLIDEMDDELYEFFTSIFDIYGDNSINPNKVNDLFLQAIDINLTEYDIKNIKEKIADFGYFQNAEELKTWIGENTRIPATNFNPLGINFSFSNSNFKIVANGYSGRISRKIVCYVSPVYNDILTKGEYEITEENNNDSTSDVIPSIIYWELD